MRAWVDCEFPAFDYVHPISIGAVAEDGSEFYCEYPHELDKCSSFVRQRVLPQLTGECGHNFADWVREHDVTELVCDTHYDLSIVRWRGYLGEVTEVRQLPADQREVEFTHHALADAKKLRDLHLSGRLGR